MAASTSTSPLKPPSISHDKGKVLVGPDLNPTRTPLDKKNYRQILLPNGLRAVLVSDTIAMHQTQNGGYYEDDESMSTDGRSDEEDDSDDEGKGGKEGRNKGGDDEDSEDGDEELEDDDDGLRDAAVSVLVGVGSFYDPPEAQVRLLLFSVG